MKKKLFIIITIIIVIFSGFMIYKTNIYGLIINENSSPYRTTLKLNWSILIPTGYTEIYELEGESNWTGDGVRYHIFQYNSSDDVDDLFDWEDGDISTKSCNNISEAVDAWLSEINVPESYYPEISDCKCWYYYLEYDEIIILWNETNNYMYVIENFI